MCHCHRRHVGGGVCSGRVPVHRQIVSALVRGVVSVYITFFGTAYGIQTGAHLGIEAFTHLLPKGGRKVLAILVQIVSMLVCTLILKLGVDIVMSQMASGQVSPAMRIPMWVIYGAIPMGMALSLIHI